MSEWRYSNSESTVASRVTKDGFLESTLVSALPKGVQILPFVQAGSDVPQQITRAQGKAALITQGYWPAIEKYIEDIADPTAKSMALVALNDTQNWERNSKFLNDIANSLEISSDELDSLFIMASKIVF